MPKVYGIDLGTINSLFGSDDRLLTGLVPPVVNLQTEEVDKSMLEDMPAARSFKRDISISKEGRLSVFASSRVPRQLMKGSGEGVQDVAVSVPIYFPGNQRYVTIKAAELTGLMVVGLINKSTAAAIYASRSHKALSLMYDLGGGTFGVSVVGSRFGDYDMQATDSCILGGDNFDANIRRWVVKQGNVKVHHLNSKDLTRLKQDCSKPKTWLQKSRRDEVLDLTPYGAGQAVPTTKIYSEIMKLTFSETITRAKKVLGGAVPVGEKYDLVMVGNSTRCPLLREQVAKEVGQEPIEMFHDPDRIVVQDAAFYAQMPSGDTAHTQVSDVTKVPSIEMADGSTHVLIPHNSKIPVQETTVVYDSITSNKLQLNLYQGDSLLTSQNELIDQLTYSYDGVIPAGEGKVIMEIAVEVDGTIRFSCKELLKALMGVVLDRIKTSIRSLAVRTLISRS